MTTASQKRRRAATGAGALALAVLAISFLMPQSWRPLAASLATPDLKAALPALAARHDVCAVVVAVIKARRITDVETAANCPLPAQLGGHSVFQVASLSKPVYAYALLKQAQLGKLDLDAPLLAHLSRGYQHRPYPFKDATSAPAPVTDPRLALVTARTALNHTSGLPNWSDGPGLTLEAAPGTRWAYSGEGYIFLQRAVDAAGLPLETIAAPVFKSLGMTRSAYSWQPRFEADFVPGTDARKKPANILSFAEPMGVGTLYTSAEDYAHFLIGVIEDAPVLQQILADPATADPAHGISWGLGFAIERNDRGAVLIHWGICPGYRAFAAISAQSGDGFVMLTNSENGLALAEPVQRLVMPGDMGIFRFPMLRSRWATFLCDTLNWCA